METLKEIRKRFGKPKRIKSKLEKPISEPDDPEDPCVFACPSGLVVRVKPMTMRDEDRLQRLHRRNTPIESITKWLQSRTEIIDSGPYEQTLLNGNVSVDWMDLIHADFEAICTATKEATHEP